jgi:putative membrane protein
MSKATSSPNLVRRDSLRSFNAELYERRNWLRILLSRGSIFLEVYKRVLAVMSISLLLCLLRYNGFPLPPWKSSAHSILGVALGLLLVYRTNSSYDRFWEGRKLWGVLFGAAKSIMRFIRTYERDLNTENLANLLTAYAVAVRQRLRGDFSSKQYSSYLTERELNFVERTQNKPVAINLLITDWIAINCKSFQTQLPKMSQVEKHTCDLSDCQGALERIVGTPIPSSYIGHLNHLLAVYLITLPFCLLDDYYWFSIIATGLVAFGLLGIEAAGAEIEDPFGTDENDLPLDNMCLAVHDMLLYIAREKEIAVKEQ